MAFSINGIGTAYYGKRDFQFHTNGACTYVTTEWFTFFYLPLVPVRSFRLCPVGPDGGLTPVVHTEQYAVFERTAPNLKQVLCIYGFLGLYALWIYLIVLVNLRLRDYFTDDHPHVLIVGSALTSGAPAFLPWLLRRHAWNKAWGKMMGEL